MKLKCIEEVAVLILLLDLHFVTCDPMYRHGAQTFQSENPYPRVAYRNFPPMDTYTMPMQEQIYHIRAPTSNYLVEEPHITDNSNFTYGDSLSAVNDLDKHHEQSRRSDYRQGLANYFPNLRGSSPSKHGHKINHAYAGNIVPANTATTSPAAENKEVSVSFLKPDWSSLTKPTEIAGTDKWSGLLQLILSFITGSTSGNLEFKGFKDIIVSTLVKPILATKGNIKSFISKITIPLLSLLLINVEVLVTVWWLWEDCPKEMKMESMDVKSANNYTYV